MASDVMSLFGLDPAILQQQRVQGGVDQASRMDKDYAIGAAGGQMLGAGINTAFGLQTPDMQQAASVQGGMEGADLTSAQGLRMAASKMMTSGNYAQGMALYQQASTLEQEANEELRTQQSHEAGQTRDVIIGYTSPMVGGGEPKPIKRSITTFYDGKITDPIAGEFDSYAAWIAAVRGEGAKNVSQPTDPSEVAGSNAQEILDNASHNAADFLLPPMSAEAVAELTERVNANVNALQAQIDALPPTMQDSPRAHEIRKRMDVWLSQLPQ